MEANKRGKIARLYPASSKVEADIPSMPAGEPISDLLARKILASQLERVAGPTGTSAIGFLLCALVIVLYATACLLMT